MKVIIAAKRMFLRVFKVFCWAFLMAPMAHGVTCESLSRLRLSETTITLAKFETASTYKPDAWRVKGPLPPTSDGLPSFCRVVAEITPVPDSKILIEVWMPVTGWNGKFMGVGNGGWSGQIWSPFMGAALRRGYATASTDTGHEGNGEDADFALGHPEKVIDFGYRAVHEMTLKAKAIIAAYYGGAPKFSYWDGCSSGGRQGLKEAQRFPTDYDGIISGAPANAMAHVSSSGVWIAQSNLEDNRRILSEDNLRLLHQAVLEACDARDGVKDGVIDDPESCHFNPNMLLCNESGSKACLTASQIQAAAKIYAGPKNPRTGEQVFPGLSRGSELGWGVFGGMLPEPPIVASYFRFLVFKYAAWDFRDLNFDGDIAKADSLDSGTIAATDPNLKEFFAHGGRLLLYHGWSDQMIAPENTVNYYNSVTAVSGANSQQSVRLFMEPGMGHCSGGEGPYEFDKVSALEDWVERGKAPELIVAAHFPGDPSVHSPDRTRPLCRYPKKARYKGVGNTDEASSFTCTK
ncbi:feruloyl esterase [Granulicella aggregans]|uniref:Feruloyl esterase n=1 Tax=Granulicella aggregans TaxID=474949 RepID=A0A7W7ZIC8_9BACT|nr:tannase/feruloyl esterase family alpha/beta hydrolase [Granulicella aggregans]MBB5060489.1 feruloyl esterase [Granulicella aggregans]